MSIPVANFSRPTCCPTNLCCAGLPLTETQDYVFGDSAAYPIQSTLQPPAALEETPIEPDRRQAATVSPFTSIMLYSVCNNPEPGRLAKAFPMPCNVTDGVPFETEGLVGKVLLLHREADDRPSLYRQYFDEHRRNWEFRVQCRFKRAPRGDLFMGLCLRDFDYRQPVSTTAKTIKHAGMALAQSYDVYMSWGDRGESAMAADAELSHFVTGMAAWDQIIMTPAGQMPPPLSADLRDLGDAHGINYQRAKVGVRAFSEAANEIFANINTETVYTLCFWGVSRIVDILAWEIKLGMKFSMSSFFQDNPMHIVMYELHHQSDVGIIPKRPRRHLESMKTYHFDFMLWSTSAHCPALRSRYSFQDGGSTFGDGHSMRTTSVGDMNPSAVIANHRSDALRRSRSWLNRGPRG